MKWKFREFGQIAKNCELLNLTKFPPYTVWQHHMLMGWVNSVATYLFLCGCHATILTCICIVLSFLEAFFDHIGDFVCKLNDATVINLFLTELRWVIVTHCRLITDCHTVTTCHMWLIITQHHLCTSVQTYVTPQSHSHWLSHRHWLSHCHCLSHILSFTNHWMLPKAI